MLTRYQMQAEVGRQAALTDQINKLGVVNSTGVRLLAASDDPAAAARIAAAGRAQSNTSTWATNVKTAASTASAADTALGGVETAVTRAQELILKGRSDTLTDSDRASIALELRNIADDIGTYATATDARGLPLFDTAGATTIPLGDGVNAAASLSYDAVFGGIDDADGQSLSDIIAAAAAMDESDATTRAAALDSSVTDITTAVDHVAARRSEQGVLAARIDSQGDRLTDIAADLTDARSADESADATSTLAELSAKMTTLEAAQAVLAKLNKGTLFDFL